MWICLLIWWAKTKWCCVVRNGRCQRKLWMSHIWITQRGRKGSRHWCCQQLTHRFFGLFSDFRWIRNRRCISEWLFVCWAIWRTAWWLSSRCRCFQRNLLQFKRWWLNRCGKSMKQFRFWNFHFEFYSGNILNFATFFFVCLFVVEGGGWVFGWNEWKAQTAP